MQLFQVLPVQNAMGTRNLDDKLEQERFGIHMLNNRYNKILILWGVQPLVELLQWFQYIEDNEGVSNVMRCLGSDSDNLSPISPPL